MEAKIGDILKSHAVWDAWIDMPDGTEKYKAYLCSPQWGQLKRIVAERSDGVCERCRTNPAYAVHHLTYERMYCEIPEDLLHVCIGCHDYIHGMAAADPRAASFAGDRPLTGIGPGEAFGGDSLVTCPYCGCENCHMGDAEVSCGLSVQVNQGEVKIPMWCECNCHWDVVFEGHKGTLRVYVTNWRHHA